ncbi:hypothetical protein K438DRAFT_1960692 [Mycena galopus ATCC 62051]|nr:hypothetical protein K438DRAFT_1960692 [Mycena galopus ATCC 62051]
MATHHIVAMIAPSWGHTVSYIQVVIQMLRRNPQLVITIVQHNLIVAQMEAELQKCVYDSARLRILGVGEKDAVITPAAIKLAFGQLMGGWMETISKLAEGPSEAWPKPRTLHMDFICGGAVIQPTKQIVGPDCKVLVWFSSALASMPGHLTDYDFAAIAQEIYADEGKRQGRSMDDILTQVCLAWNGTDKVSGMTIKCPGAPDMYDYERYAYATGPPEGIAQLLVSAQTLAKASDGYISTTTTCIEPVAVPQCKEFYKQRGQEVFTVGLQAPDECWGDAAPAAITNMTVKTFLDNAVNQHGAKSVLYISFGSLFFPVATPELIEALVNTLLLLPNPFPFIFALGGKLASLPKEIIEKVNSGSRGLVCDFWVEQRAILQHGAVGWFLTHGGFNSITESLSQGIPLIVWPTNGEQPVNAALISAGPNPVAIELVQVRTGAQLGPSLRGGPTITGTVADATDEFRTIFEEARGARGAVLTANAANMRKALKESRGGEAYEELSRLSAF